MADTGNNGDGLPAAGWAAMMLAISNGALSRLDEQQAS